MKQDGKLTNRMKDLFVTFICSKIFVFPAQLKAHTGSPSIHPKLISSSWGKYHCVYSNVNVSKTFKSGFITFFFWFTACLNLFYHCFSMDG